MSKQLKKTSLFDHQQKNKNKSAIISTAFQDHIIKQLQLTSLNSFGLPSSNLNKNKLPKIEVKSKVDSGLKIITTSAGDQAEVEYVLDESKNRFKTKTLAEKYGLVPLDEKTNLNENEWVKIKDQYIKRGDVKEPCVICKEVMGIEQQVLLSCSHTFHRKCLEAFERFSGKKTCPMCRKDQYEKRVIFDASKHHKNLCAAKIQAAWRGYIFRKWYLKYRKENPPNNPILRKKYFEEKLSDVTNRIVCSFNYETDHLISDIDRNIEKSREIFKNFEEKYKILNEQDWIDLMLKALARNNDECSICINKMDISPDLANCLNNQRTNNKDTDETLRIIFNKKLSKDYCCKPLVLLSCSHIYHDICLKTFEELNFDRARSCPECRNSLYQKYELGNGRI